MIEIVGTRSVFPCFGVFSLKHVISTLRKRLFMHLEVRARPSTYGYTPHMVTYIALCERLFMHLRCTCYPRTRHAAWSTLATPAPLLHALRQLTTVRSGLLATPVVATLATDLTTRAFRYAQVGQVDAAFRKTIKLTTAHWGSRKYDWFQNKQRGIAI